MGTVIDVRMNLGPLASALARLSRIDWKPTLGKIRKPMHTDQRQHRDAQRGPQGPWAALAASTLARYARQGKRRNRRILARLPNARKTKVTARDVTMFSPVRWSMAHQRGARVGHGSILPQRQYMYISPWLVKQARRQFWLDLYAHWRRVMGI